MSDIEKLKNKIEECLKNDWPFGQICGEMDEVEDSQMIEALIELVDEKRIEFIVV